MSMDVQSVESGSYLGDVAAPRRLSVQQDSTASEGYQFKENQFVTSGIHVIFLSTLH